MIVRRKSMMSGKVHEMDLDITDFQITKYLHGAKVQDAFPHLTPAQREFIMSGITPEEWETLKEKEE